MTEKDMAMVGAIIMLVFELALFVTFLVLKLTAVITWSWLWVVAPIWIPLVLGFIFMCLGIKPPGME